jgi:hypothetical protein
VNVVYLPRVHKNRARVARENVLFTEPRVARANVFRLSALSKLSDSPAVNVLLLLAMGFLFFRLLNCIPAVTSTGPEAFRIVTFNVKSLPGRKTFGARMK